MIRRLRNQLSYANVISTTCLVLILGGGTAYAINEWTGANIVNGSLTNVDYKNNDIRSGDIKNESSTYGGLTSADLGENSVGAHQFQFGVLQSHARTWAGSTADNTTSPKELTVECPLADNGEEVTGGGYVISHDGSNVPSVVVQRSYAVDEHTWLVRAVATSGAPSWQLTVVANCIQ